MLTVKDVDEALQCEVFGFLRNRNVRFLADLPELVQIQILGGINLDIDCCGLLALLAALEEVLEGAACA